jgi:DNA-binding winged helix-turn-helix (wHTH) protein
MVSQPQSFGGAAQDLASASRIRRFGVFEVDLWTGELRKRGMKIKVQEQPFQLLAALLERSGDLVTREELMQRLWPGSNSVRIHLRLNQAMAKLRFALGDSAENPRYIETLHQRGFRFLAVIMS